MRTLRRALLAQAAVSAVSGIALAAVPKFVLVDLFDQLHYPEYAWVRVAGVESFVLALFAVLVAQRLEDFWWWSWAFVISSGGAALLFALNAGVGLQCAMEEGARRCPSTLLWWGSAAIAAALTGALLLGLARAGRESPLP